MTLILCVDEALGLSFNRRRQSRDQAVCEDILRTAAGRKVRVLPESAGLFADLTDDLVVGAEALNNWQPDDLIFVEQQPGNLIREAETLILYYWNRRYPADCRLDITWENWKLKERIEFAGKSHKCITREVYEK